MRHYVTFLFLTLSFVKYGSSWSYFCTLKCGNSHVACRREPCGKGPLCGQDFKMFEMSDSDRNKIIDLHNTFRRSIATGKFAFLIDEVANMNALSYDKELEFMAQCAANSCIIESYDLCRCSSKFRDVGRNFYRSQNRVLNKLNNELMMEVVISSWMDELSQLKLVDKIQYRYSSKLKHKNGIQATWASVTHVGCGRVLGGVSGSLVICNYGPKGIKLNDSIWINGPPCTRCPNGLPCDQDLCGTVRNVTDDLWKPPFAFGAEEKQLFSIVVLIFSFIINIYLL